MNEIANAFGVSPEMDLPKNETAVSVIEKATGELQKRLEQNIDADYDFVRDNLRDMITQTMETIPNLIDLIQQSESARMYESGAAFMKMIADLNKDLISTSKELESAGGSKAKPPTPVSTPSGETTQIFIGTGSDVFSQLGKRKTVIQEISELPPVNAEVTAVHSTK